MIKLSNFEGIKFQLLQNITSHGKVYTNPHIFINNIYQIKVSIESYIDNTLMPLAKVGPKEN